MSHRPDAKITKMPCSLKLYGICPFTAQRRLQNPLSPSLLYINHQMRNIFLVSSSFLWDTCLCLRATYLSAVKELRLILLIDRLNTAQFPFYTLQLLQNHVYQSQSRQLASTHVLLSFSLVYLSIQPLLITWIPETQEYPFGACIGHDVGKSSVTRASDNKTRCTEKPLGILD